MSGVATTLMHHTCATRPPAVSIIVPVYNAAQYLEDSLGSVLAQDFRELEVICIDDASTDSSAAIIEAIAREDPRVVLLRQEQNAGAPAARNRGMAAARGDYLLFLDADDALCAGALASLVQMARDTGAAAVKGLMMVDRGNRKRAPHWLNQSRAWGGTSLRDCPDVQHLYQYQSYLFDAGFIRGTGTHFDQALRNFQDPVFLAHLLPHCKRIEVTDIPVYLRKFRPGSIVTSAWKRENFESLVSGVANSYQYLIEHDQPGAAARIALTFSNWWYKFESMPADLDREQCIAIFSMMRDFINASQHPVTSGRWNKVGAEHCLTMIAEGRFEACYSRLARRYQLSRRGLLPAIKVLDLAARMLTGRPGSEAQKIAKDD